MLPPQNHHPAPHSGNLPRSAEGVGEFTPLNQFEIVDEPVGASSSERG